MASDKITDYSARALALLPGFKQAGAIRKALLDVIMASAVDLEDTLDDLLNLRALDTAEGVQLDLLGTLLDMERVDGDSDAIYRAALRIQYSVLFKSGEPETLIQLYKEVTGAEQVQLQEIYPATVQLTGYASAEIASPDVRILELMEMTKAAGVDLILVWANYKMLTLSKESEADIDGNGPTDTDFGLGSADPGQTDGGRLPRVIV